MKDLIFILSIGDMEQGLGVICLTFKNHHPLCCAEISAEARRRHRETDSKLTATIQTERKCLCNDLGCCFFSSNVSRNRSFMKS